jgi:hypothetical protein
MRRSLRSSVLLRITVLTAVVAALLIPAAPAAANGHRWVLTSDPVAFKRGGATYQLTVRAQESLGGSDHIAVIVSQIRDPRGPVKATQSIMWHWYLNGDRFRAANTLGSARINTATEFKGFGAVDLKYTATSRLTRLCSGNLKTRMGKLSGTVTLKTGTTRFGTIKVSPSRAELLNSNGKCDTDTRAPYNAKACPTPVAGVNAFLMGKKESWMLNASAPVRGPAVISIGSGGSLSKAGYFYNTIQVELPNENVKFTNPLKSGAIRSVRNVWLDGAAVFEAERDPYSQSRECGSDRMRTDSQASGIIKGQLKTSFWMADNFDMSRSKSWDASAWRIAVGSR